ncbi:hypothetical protein EW145_g1615 [Phellinidium pouzarii]|uniref:Uncharacterized protein n=1 Tax=Phellinidium pouzarii TaxID=167371 RepID=A0A4V3XDJ6_9AGAM|nr:hypothetical protein EW145_g1615 [Phellinidium pouzarii]
MPERTSFLEVLAIVHAFLTDPATSSETIVMSIKQEDFATTPPAEFSTLVHDELYSGPGGRDMWFLENRVPQLGEVRGKVIMLSRFGGDGAGWENGLEGMGIHPTTWPDSQKDGFEWTLNDTLVRTSDWYNIPSVLDVPEKVSLATAVLLPPSGGYTQPTLNISFFSAGSFPLALPPAVAKGFGWPAWKLGVEGVNARIGTWLLSQLSTSESVAPKGWVFMDFFKSPEGLVPLLVECNFRDPRDIYSLDTFPPELLPIGAAVAADSDDALRQPAPAAVSASRGSTSTEVSRDIEISRSVRRKAAPPWDRHYSSGCGSQGNSEGLEGADITYNPSSLAPVLLTYGFCLVFFLVALDNIIIETSIQTIMTVFDSLDDIGWY